MLADFRVWLDQLAGAGEPPARANPEPGEPIDLHTLLSQLIALRHEVHLQTRATRAQQEQTAETVRRLEEALAVDESTAENADEDDSARPLLKTLIDLRDALTVAQREVQRVRETVLPALDRLALPLENQPYASPAATAALDLDAAQLALPFLARWLPGRKTLARVIANQHKVITAQRTLLAHQHQQLEASQALDAVARNHPAVRSDADQVRHLLDSLFTGYTMSLERLNRALQQHGLEAILCEGDAFDPDRMEAVEVVTDSEAPPGHVVSEIRRGYLWRGRVFRYAQVAVAKM